MAVKSLESFEDIKATVYLKDGTIIGPADIPTQLYSEYEQHVGIWQGDVLHMYPIGC
jgi:hypothetical protein